MRTRLRGVASPEVQGRRRTARCSLMDDLRWTCSRGLLMRSPDHYQSRTGTTCAELSAASHDCRRRVPGSAAWTSTGRSWNDRRPWQWCAGQLGFSWMELHRALDGLTDQEWAWEPVPAAHASLRRRADAQPADHLVGAGDWVMEWPADDDSDSRTRTIAWLVAHLTEAFFERHEHAFGGHEKRRDDVVFAGTAHRTRSRRSPRRWSRGRRRSQTCRRMTRSPWASPRRPR